HHRFNGDIAINLSGEIEPLAEQLTVYDHVNLPVREAYERGPTILLRSVAVERNGHNTALAKLMGKLFGTDYGRREGNSSLAIRIFPPMPHSPGQNGAASHDFINL